MGLVHDVMPRVAASFAPGSSESITNCPGSFTGSARRIKLSTSEKIAVLAPMPRASERMATMETTGVARKARKARRMS